jgi:prepilin-type N-terminal cleavage/methylation domain-containing protein
MIRHTRRANRGDSGVTLMELLIAMVIAAIFFTAAVPLFVQAVKVGSRDRMRVVAVNAAQDRIEQIHQLDYDQVTEANLASASFYPGVFGPTWTVTTAAGARDLSVSYTVTTNAASSTSAGDKVVTITVTWAGNPAGKPVVLSTIVYRQYAGPQIVSLTVEPYLASNDTISSPSVTLTATINSASIPSMEPVTIGSATIQGYVTFTITAASGAISTVTVPYNSTHTATYTTPWTAPGGSGIADGYYTFSAVAYTATSYPGNTWTIKKRIESGKPGPVSDLTAQGLRNVNGVTLNWTGSASADVVQYLVERTGGAAFTPVTLKAPATGYTDPTAIADTAYTYTVTAVDWMGNKSTSVSKAAEWLPPVTAPDPALALAASQSSPAVAQVTLSWNPPSTIPNPILGYQIYAAGDGTTPVATSSGTSTTISTGVTWGGTYWYQVKPYVQGGLVSASWATLAAGQTAKSVSGTDWAQVTIGGQPTYTLAVVADFTPQNKNDEASITLVYLGNTDAGSGTAIGTQTGIAANASASWSDLQSGWYRISYTTQKSSGSKDVNMTGTPFTQSFNMI